MPRQPDISWRLSLASASTIASTRATSSVITLFCFSAFPPCCPECPIVRNASAIWKQLLSKDSQYVGRRVSKSDGDFYVGTVPSSWERLFFFFCHFSHQFLLVLAKTLNNLFRVFGVSAFLKRSRKWKPEDKWWNLDQRYFKYSTFKWRHLSHTKDLM